MGRPPDQKKYRLEDLQRIRGELKAALEFFSLDIESLEEHEVQEICLPEKNGLHEFKRFANSLATSRVSSVVDQLEHHVESQRNDGVESDGDGAAATLLLPIVAANPIAAAKPMAAAAVAKPFLHEATTAKLGGTTKIVATTAITFVVLAFLCWPSIVRTDSGQDYLVWEEKNVVQRFFGMSGSYRYVTDGAKRVLYRGPLLNGEAHGVWRQSSTNGEIEVEFKHGFYEPYRVNSNKKPHSFETWSPIQGIPAPQAPSEHIDSFRRGIVRSCSEFFDGIMLRFS